MSTEVTTATRDAALARARLKREATLHEESVQRAADEIRAKLQNGDAESITALRIDTDWGTLIALRPASIRTPNYQRHLRANRVRKMAQKFDPRLYGVVLVTMRSGKPSVIDGQHRIAAAIQAGHGDDALPALVIPTSTYREEAELFVRANLRETTVPAATGEVFHARIEQGDERATMVAKVVEDAGLQLDMHMESDGEGFVRAIATLERIFKQGGPEHLADVLTTLLATYGGQRGSTAHWMLMGFHQFLYRFHDFADRARLAEQLRPLTADGLTARAMMARIAEGGYRRHDSGVAIGRTMRNIYNESQGKKLPEWDSVPMALSRTLPPGTLHLLRPTHTGRKS